MQKYNKLVGAADSSCVGVSVSEFIMTGNRQTRNRKSELTAHFPVFSFHSMSLYGINGGSGLNGCEWRTDRQRTESYYSE